MFLMILGGRGDRALPVFVDALKETSQHELAERLESHIAGVYNQSPAAIEGLAGSLNIPSEKLTAGKTPAQIKLNRNVKWKIYLIREIVSQHTHQMYI